MQSALLRHSSPSIVTEFKDKNFICSVEKDLGQLKYQLLIL